MKRTLVTNEEIIQQVADSYCIPCDRIMEVHRIECTYTDHFTYEAMTACGDGYMGCGHPTCTACCLKSACGIVGDAAIEMYMEVWLEKFRRGEDIPAYVKKCLTSDTWEQRYLTS